MTPETDTASTLHASEWYKQFQSAKWGAAVQQGAAGCGCGADDAVLSSRGITAYQGGVLSYAAALAASGLTPANLIALRFHVGAPHFLSSILIGVPVVANRRQVHRAPPSLRLR